MTDVAVPAGSVVAVIPAKDEAERALMWKGRKSAFAAVGRISPNYTVQDGVIPRSEIAKVLRGKHKPVFTPNVDAGDFVIVVNARGVKLSGKKLDKKVYYRHTEYPGGIRERTAAKMLAEKPEPRRKRKTAD